MRKCTKRLISIGICIAFVVSLLFFAQEPNNIVYIDEEAVPFEGELIDFGVTAQPNSNDTVIMPDKYNTGFKGELKNITENTLENGVLFSGNNNNVLILDFCHKNKNITGTITISDCDFSNYQLNMYNEQKVERKIHVIFENCKFSKIITGKTEARVTYEFNNCTINSFGGSNSTFDSCQFGSTYMDGLVPYQNISVNNCFFADFTSMVTDVPNHIDGTQLYGSKDTNVKNVKYINCRFEIPPIKSDGSAATVNACIMLQLEFANAENVSFTNCTVNGGGYSIYARATGDWSFSNVSISGINVGCARKHGIVYPDMSSQVSINEINNTTSLYIGSIWKENGATHFSVTNDTDTVRKLVIYTDTKRCEFVIPACPIGTEITGSMKYSDFPFDIDIMIPTDCKYAVCFDETERNPVQIRYQNWSNEAAYISSNLRKTSNSLGSVSSTLSVNENKVIDSGNCGDTSTYELTSNGTLTISGTGDITLFRNQKDIPWYSNISKIKKIVVEDGITALSRGLFKNCQNLKEAVLPEGLTTIDKEVFSGCVCLMRITVPTSIKLIDKYAFSKTLIQNIQYSGTSEEFDNIEIAIGNETIDFERVNKIIETAQTPVDHTDTNANSQKTSCIQSGACGESIIYTIDEDGLMLISGKGKTYNYHSAKLPPWWDIRKTIKEVVVEEGVTILGTGMFKECDNLSKVSLPETLIVIDGTAFLGCKKLAELAIPISVKIIGKYAFGSKGVQTILYAGTKEEWKRISIEKHNEALDKCLIITK